MIINYNAHKVFQFNDCKYLLVGKTGGLYELDKQTAALIEKNGLEITTIKDEMIREFGSNAVDVEILLKEFREINLLGDERTDNVVEYSLDYIHGIEIMVCQGCNLACSYCYASEGEYNNPGNMSETIGREAIDFLFLHTKSNIVNISFFGGEPLLNFALIKDLVEYADALAIQYDKRVAYAVTTNGTLITDAIADFLSKKNFYVSFSVDGTQAKHDFYRVDKRGTGSYLNAIRNLDLLPKERMSLRATATPLNCDYVEISNALYHLVPTDFYIDEAMNCFKTKESLGDIKKAYDMLTEDFYRDLQRSDIKKCRANSKVYNALKKVSRIGTYTNNVGCSAFINSLAVDIDGDLYPCHRFVGSPYVIGNVNRTKIDVKSAKQTYATDFTIGRRIKCLECWAQKFCSGGCPYLNYDKNGQCSKPNEEKCELNKYFYEKIIKLFLMLTKEEKVALDIVKS